MCTENDQAEIQEVENLAPSSEEITEASAEVSEELPSPEASEEVTEASAEVSAEVSPPQGNDFTDFYPEMLWDYFDVMKYSRLQKEEAILKMAKDRGDSDTLRTLFCFLPVEQERIEMGIVKMKRSEKEKVNFYNLRDALKALRFSKDQIEKTDPALYINGDDLKELKRVSFRGFKKKAVVNTVEEQTTEPVTNKEEENVIHTESTETGGGL